jgi:hypothetical protein
MRASGVSSQQPFRGRFALIPRSRARNTPQQLLRCERRESRARREEEERTQALFPLRATTTADPMRAMREQRLNYAL